MVVSTDSLKMGKPPGGYSYFGIAEGQPRIEFHDDPGQVIVRYKVGTGYEQTKMLSVCYSPAGAALAFVESKEPRRFALGRLQADYFDGHWVPGPGEGQWDTIVGPVHWDTSTQHSLLFKLPDGSALAIRCSPSYIQGAAGLLDAASEVPLIRALR
ncbi:hypothetical protein [Arthrobacter sp. PsM3]|uniref:hypothetical protein n=1 Tax=Arthrobacter sp. PsM3 TaxID=3030531 RepID=UPI00263B56B4|nr:hypothetical protein [Arthrobacter sp. PsM3]MDN4643403.1 hypothetical protein [Arthrobacter sp. PsM3]